MSAEPVPTPADAPAEPASSSLGSAMMARVRTAPGTFALIAMAVLAFVVVYQAVFAWLVDTWLTNPYYGHGLLVVPLALYVAYRRRARFRAAPQEVHGIDHVVLALAGLLFVAGRYFSSNHIQGWSLLPLLVGVLLATQGRERTRVLLWPLAMLVLVLPLPLLEGFFAPLQAVAANGAGHISRAIGVLPFVDPITVTWDSATLTANGITFAIVPLCAGLSSTLSLYAVTATGLLLWPVPLKRRLALYALVLPIALAANMLRITSTVLVAVNQGRAAGTAWHDGPGGILLYLIALLLIGALVYLARSERLFGATPEAP